MLKHNNLTSRLLKPHFLFTGFTLLIYFVLLMLDLSHETLNSRDGIVRDTFTGNLFLALCLSIFTMTTLTAYVTRFRKSMVSWLAASVMCLLLIFFSFFAFYNGRRVVTEADGPAAVSYGCIWSEMSDTVESFTSSFSDTSPGVRNRNLCVLKNMPLAASNYTSWSTNQDLWDDTILIMYGSLILASYLVPKLLYRKNTNA